jgi:hypothetical protein
LQALKHKDEFPEAFETIAKACLVDDMADLRPSKDQVKELVNQLINFFPLCAIDIRKFVANSYHLMTDLKPEQRVKDLEDNEILKQVFKGQIPVTKIKIFGLIWDYVMDYIKFNFTSVERSQRPITKLKMLQLLHSLYNLLGILMPFLIMAKLLIQNCWRIGLTWKDELPLRMEKGWFAWQEQIDQLGDIQIERTLILGEKPDNHNTQLHVFVDASQDVYSAVAYIRNSVQQNFKLRFVQAKSRLKPIQAAHSILRMELCAAEMGLALAKKLITTLDIQHDNIYMWTYSRAVHDWLRVESRALQVFVKNRVVKIRQYLFF